MKYVLDTHTHTIASGHAYNTITEMVEAAKKKGLEAIAITDHAPKMPGTCHEFYFTNLKAIDRSVYEGIEVLFGTELNIIDYDGHVDLSDKVLSTLDIVIASFHVPCIAPGTIEENTNALIKAMENPYINIIGHPDDNRFKIDFEQVVEASKVTGTLLELNNSSLRPGGSRVDPIENDKEMIRICKEKRVPIVVGSDAHHISYVGEHKLAYDMLAEENFPEELIINTSLQKLKNFINKHKSSLI